MKRNQYGERMCACGHPWRQHTYSGPRCWGGYATCTCSGAVDAEEDRTALEKGTT
jgi:hypothetical protein